MSVHELFAYLCVRDAQAAIDFYRDVFGASETLRLVEPGGRIGHAEVTLGPHTLMLCEEFPEYGIRAPEPDAATSVTLHLHVDNADAWIERAVAAGATVLRPATDAFYGERSGSVRDPFGHEWLVGHQLEEVAPQEMQRRYTALFAK